MKGGATREVHSAYPTSAVSGAPAPALTPPRREGEATVNRGRTGGQPTPLSRGGVVPPFSFPPSSARPSGLAAFFRARPASAVRDALSSGADPVRRSSQQTTVILPDPLPGALGLPAPFSGAA